MKILLWVFVLLHSAACIKLAVVHSEPYAFVDRGSSGEHNDTRGYLIDAWSQIAQWNNVRRQIMRFILPDHRQRVHSDGGQ